jgi:hypothetical protein
MKSDLLIGEVWAAMFGRSSAQASIFGYRRVRSMQGFACGVGAGSGGKVAYHTTA